MHGKKQTYFVDLAPDGNLKDHRPRFALERAIELLVKLDYPTAAEREQIYGAEWWVQRRSSTENIGFHYDKDEAAASMDSLLKCPTEGTITYMTDNGAPTVILNRTTPQGNDPDPWLVTWAALSYSKRNRHVLFRGNLAHGVAGSLSQSKDERITFLVNYWQYKPIEPNCVHVDNALMKNLGLGGMGKKTVAMTPEMMEVELSAEIKPTELENLSFDASTEVQHVDVMLREEDHWYIELPKTLTPALYNISWEPKQVANLVRHLDIDLWSEDKLEQLWEAREPKLLLFTEKSGDNFEAIASAVFPLVHEYLHKLIFLVVDPATSTDVLEAFGLTEKDLPTVGIHNTYRSDEKYLLELDAKDGATLTTERAREFIGDYFGGKLTAISDEEEEEEGEEL